MKCPLSGSRGGVFFCSWWKQLETLEGGGPNGRSGPREPVFPLELCLSWVRFFFTPASLPSAPSPTHSLSPFLFLSPVSPSLPPLFFTSPLSIPASRRCEVNPFSAAIVLSRQGPEGTECWSHAWESPPLTLLSLRSRYSWRETDKITDEIKHFYKTIFSPSPFPPFSPSFIHPSCHSFLSFYLLCIFSS